MADTLYGYVSLLKLYRYRGCTGCALHRTPLRYFTSTLGLILYVLIKYLDNRLPRSVTHNPHEIIQVLRQPPPRHTIRCTPRLIQQLGQS